MRQMRNKRNGRLAVYDESVISAPGSSWEEYTPEPERSGEEDEVIPTDSISIQLIRADGTTEHR